MLLWSHTCTDGGGYMFVLSNWAWWPGSTLINYSDGSTIDLVVCWVLIRVSLHFLIRSFSLCRRRVLRTVVRCATVNYLSSLSLTSNKYLSIYPSPHSFVLFCFPGQNHRKSYYRWCSALIFTFYFVLWWVNRLSLISSELMQRDI